MFMLRPLPLLWVNILTCHTLRSITTRTPLQPLQPLRIMHTLRRPLLMLPLQPPQPPCSNSMHINRCKQALVFAHSFGRSWVSAHAHWFQSRLPVPLYITLYMIFAEFPLLLYSFVSQFVYRVSCLCSLHIARESLVTLITHDPCLLASTVQRQGSLLHKILIF